MIDIKASFDKVINQWGHKAIYRRYLTGQPSAHYDTVTKEGVGGAKWQHVDSVVKCRDNPRSAVGDKGNYESAPTYYLASECQPKKDDCIIEVSANSLTTSDNVVLASQHRHVMRIEDIDAKRGANGEIAFYQVTCAPEYGYY